jgi:hypothetical protein
MFPIMRDKINTMKLAIRKTEKIPHKHFKIIPGVGSRQKRNSTPIEPTRNRTPNNKAIVLKMSELFDCAPKEY